MANKTPPPPVNTPDNLRSNDKMEAILALCHGPIKGLVNGDKSFLVGEVPLQRLSRNGSGMRCWLG